MAPFEYQHYRNPYVGSIADLMMRPADAQAAAAERIGQYQANAAQQSGQAWAGAAQGVGNAIGGAIQQATDPRQKLQAIQLQQAQQGVADLKALDAAYQQPGGRDAIINALPGHLKGQVLQQFEQHDKVHAEAQKAQEEADRLSTEAFADTGANIAAHKYDPVSAQLALSDLKTKYAGNPMRLSQLRQAEAAIQQSPTADTVKSIVDPLIAASPKHVELQQKDTAQAETGRHNLAEEDIATQARQRQAAAEAETARHNAATEAAATLQEGRQEAVNRETTRHNLAMESQGDAAPKLTPEARTMAARQYAMTGQLPPMGMGKSGAAVRTDIINEAAKQYANLDLPTQVAAYKANQDSLKKIQVQADSLKAFENTAGKNMDVFLGLASKVVDTGSPILNRPIRAIDAAALGGTEQAAFNVALRTVIPEYAKILSNPGMSGQLSDSARKEIEQVVSGNATLGQLIASANILKQDTQNRRESYDQQIADIQKRIATPPGQAATAPRGEEWIRDASGKLVKKGG